MSKVFIVNKSGHDFKDAKRFGEFVYLSEGKMDRYAITSVYREFSDVLDKSSEKDHILLTGLTSMCSIACSIFAYKWGCLNLLLYKNNRYIERRLILGELIEKEEQDE